MSYKESQIVFESGMYWVLDCAQRGYEIYKVGVTGSTRCARIGYVGEKGLTLAKQEIERRQSVELDRQIAAQVKLRVKEVRKTERQNKAFVTMLQKAKRKADARAAKPSLEAREAVLTGLCEQLGEEYSWDKVARSVDGYPLYRLNRGADWPLGSLRRSYPQFLKALQNFAVTKGLSQV